LVNNAGSGAISLTGGGRWLVYSANATGDTFGSLDSGNTAIWNATYGSLAPASVTATGNRYIFAYQPTLNVTSTSATKTYGNAYDVSGSYTITGYDTGVTGVFLADNFSTTLSGDVAAISTGAAATANAGSDRKSVV
jgi:hypothetical protein